MACGRRSHPHCLRAFTITANEAAQGAAFYAGRHYRAAGRTVKRAASPPNQSTDLRRAAGSQLLRHGRPVACHAHFLLRVFNGLNGLLRPLLLAITGMSGAGLAPGYSCLGTRRCAGCATGTLVPAVCREVCETLQGNLAGAILERYEMRFGAYQVCGYLRSGIVHAPGVPHQLAHG